jgi:hypothetical protein
MSISAAPTMTGVPGSGCLPPHPHTDTPFQRHPLFHATISAGYVNFSSTHHDWSDGFRLVRKQKYGEESDGLSGDYNQLLAVGGLQGKEHLWPQILKDYVHVSRGLGFLAGCFKHRGSAVVN